MNVNNTTFKPSQTVRNLGVFFDSSMTMSTHVTRTCKSINYHIRNISKIRKYVDTNTCHAAARALVLSRLDYCNSLLNGIKQADIDRLQRLQNNAARIIFLQPKYTHASTLLEQLHWLPVKQRITFKTSVNMHKALSNVLPQYLTESLNFNKPGRSGLCSGQNLTIPRTHKMAGDRSFSVAGPRCWNALPSHIRNTNTLQTFKSKLKTHLFS